MVATGPVQQPADPLVRRLATGVLVFTVLVILGGSVVRATDSGAGCGDQWPRCEGHIIPWSADGATAVEFGHRAMTLVLGLLIVGLVIAVLRRTPPQAPIRQVLAWAGGFFVAEVAIGALLVLFGWVEDDASTGRVVALTIHLVNTFLLLAALTLVVWLARGGESPAVEPARTADRLLLAGALTLLVVSASGALNALADTLFPVAEGATTGHFLVELRVLHPAIAVVGGVAVVVLSRARVLAAPAAEGWRRAVAGIVAVQFLMGVLNIALLTPVETQVLHLLLADTLWIVWILFAASVITADRPVAVGA
jgi:heme a synthase